MSDKIAELKAALNQDSPSAWVSHYWDKYNHQRSGKLAEWMELRNYLFATDTSTTSNSSLPWKNSTTIPKLCQIRDNLHSNYKSALFPNDNWLSWKGFDADSVSKKKALAIEVYMANKVQRAEFEDVYDQLLYDYIDYGNVFVSSGFESRYKVNAAGEEVVDYSGPVPYRISPLDIVFNPTATNFDRTHKVIRSIKTIGELKKLAKTDPDQAFWEKAIKRREDIKRMAGGHSKEDFEKAQGYSADGFGSLYEYYTSDYVEILEFFGDYHDSATGELQVDRIITVVDRSVEVRNEPAPQWLIGGGIRHCGWRKRPDNLWHMGPLENLVGLQYRLDHLENLKADAMDLCVHPPLKVIGEVEEFVWGPGVEITVDENGDVQELGKNLNGIMAAASEMAAIEDRMELYAGAPREAAGIRTPGEKTLGEVMQLATAAGRVFQNKVTHFEKNLLEPNINDMLESARRNLEGVEVISYQNEEAGVKDFLEITARDLSGNGTIRPIGARHFAKQSQDLQNLLLVMNSQLGAMLQPHTSSKGLANFINDITGLEGYKIFSPMAGLKEAQEIQSASNSLQEEGIAFDSTDTSI